MALLAFLFSALALSASRGDGSFNAAVALLFGAVGLLCSITTHVSVRAADDAMEKTAEKWTHVYYDVPNARYLPTRLRDIVAPVGLLPAIKGAGGNGKIAWRDAYLPLGPMLFWFVLCSVIVLEIHQNCGAPDASTGCIRDQLRLLVPNHLED
ncbi:MAG: hypothetical protein AAFP87_09210 [Pseudomonadota bacterium]